jgi:hypothetical protein
MLFILALLFFSHLLLRLHGVLFFETLLLSRKNQAAATDKISITGKY